MFAANVFLREASRLELALARCEKERTEMYRRYADAEKAYDNACRDYAELSTEKTVLQVERDELKAKLADAQWTISDMINPYPDDDEATG
jgi:chromosome segregation ATPase